MEINSQGYVCRSIHGKRNWWLIKWNGKYHGYANIGRIKMPKFLVGKKVRFKIEVIEDESKMD